MTLSERAQELVSKIDAAAKLPLLVRAVAAEKIVREAAGILADVVERLTRLEVLTGNRPVPGLEIPDEDEPCSKISEK